MEFNSAELLQRLGAGESIPTLCNENSISTAEFDQWWNAEIRRRTPDTRTVQPARVNAKTRIARNRWGVPHILADNDEDLFFGFGFAMAQDRLFQLDYLRRKGQGRLSEILGQDGVHLDTVARTIGLNRIAASEWNSTPAETRTLLQKFSDGVNALIEQSSANLPVEFALLDYEPEEWLPVDCLAIAAEFRYYLTVRFPVIVGPELARRALGDDTLFQAFLTGEADEESILTAGGYPAAESGVSPVRRKCGGPARGPRQQQLGCRRRSHAVGAANGRQRPTHRLCRRLLLVRSAIDGWLIRRSRHGLRRHARGHVRAQPARRLGHYQQHLFATRPLRGANRSPQSWLLPLRRRVGNRSARWRKRSRCGANLRSTKQSASLVTAQSLTKSCPPRPPQPAQSPCAGSAIPIVVGSHHYWGSTAPVLSKNCARRRVPGAFPPGA